jgi:rubrerythrin
MNIEEAITTAIKYEEKVRDVYIEARNASGDNEGKRIFGLMAKEEQYHVDYLLKRLTELKENGVINFKTLKTTVPSIDKIKNSVSQLKSSLSEKDYADELLMLRKALEVEKDTYNFYLKLVDQLEGDHQSLFRNFLKMEESHQAIVQAEIDYLQRAGFWYDFPEFDLEAE